MMQRMTPKSTLAARSVAFPLDGEESFSDLTTASTNRSSLYAVAVALRIGLLAAILLKAFAIWQW